MPQSLQMAVFILGAVLLLISILSGGFKIFGAEVSGKVGIPGRMIAFVLSLIFFTVGLVGSFQKDPGPSPSPVSQASPALTSSSPTIQAATTFATPSKSEDREEEPEPESGRQSGRKPEVADLSGYWQDETGSVVHIMQSGDSFEFTLTNNFTGGSARGRGTVGTHNAEVEFVATNFVAGQPVVSQGTGTLTFAADRRHMQGNFNDSTWGPYGHYFFKK